MLNYRKSINEQVYTMNVRSASNSFSPTFFSNILIMLFLIVCYHQTTAQEVKEVKAVFASSDAKKTERLNSLMYDLQTTIYLENGEKKFFGEGAPVCIKSDVHTIKKLGEKNSKFAEVEYLQIKLNEFGEEANLKLTPESVSGLVNLKYILVRSSYELSNKKFEDIFSGFEKTGITVFYEVSIPN